MLVSHVKTASEPFDAVMKEIQVTNHTARTQNVGTPLHVKRSNWESYRQQQEHTKTMLTRRRVLGHKTRTKSRA